jgi:hypothetical protein
MSYFRRSFLDKLVWTKLLIKQVRLLLVLVFTRVLTILLNFKPLSQGSLNPSVIGLRIVNIQPGKSLNLLGKLNGVFLVFDPRGLRLFIDVILSKVLKQL